MADDNIKKLVTIGVDNSEANAALAKTAEGLDKIDANATRVTQTTSNHTKALEHNKKSLLDNGGATGLLAAATHGMSNDFKDAIEAAEGLGISLKGVRGAIIATGIGALAIVLIELITNWEKWSKVIDGSAAAMERLNGQIAVNNKAREESQRLATINIANMEEELRLMQAQGKSQDELIAKQNLISEAKAKQARLDIATYEDTLAKIELVIAADTKYATLKNELFNLETGQTQRSEADTRRLIELKKGEIAQYELANPLLKQKQEYTDKLTAAQTTLNASINDPKVREAEEARRKALEEQNRLLAREEVLVGRIYTKLNSAIATIKNVSSATDAIKFDENGEVFNKLTGLSKLWYDNQLAVVNYTKAKNELAQEETKEIGIINKNATLNADERKKEIDAIQLRFKTKKEEIKLALDGLNLSEKTKDANDTIQKQFSVILDGLEKQGKVEAQLINDAEHLNDLKLEQFKLENKLMDFEKGFEKNGKWMDDRTNNSTKYIEIEKRINDIYTSRENIVKTNFTNSVNRANDEKKILEEKQAAAEQEADRLKAKLKEARDNGVDINSEGYVKMAREENKYRAASIDFSNQVFQKQLDITKLNLDAETELKLLAAQKEIDIENNTLNKKRDLRAEHLERERMYWDASIGIANESANLLDALAAQGDKNSRKYAEAALIVKKVAGVANVVISTQEEIRNIWANPALTALPDTGATTKTALSIGAGLRGALSIATILAQKLGSSANSSSAGGGANAPAQFNIVGSSPTNQLAAQIGAKQNQPVNTYVVGSDVSTQQALDRNRVTNATFL